MTDVPLFAAPTPTPLKLSGLFADQAGQKGAYTKYRPAVRVACDECVGVIHAHNGVGPPPRASRYIRRALGKILRLCSEHADLWRAVDERNPGL